MENKLIESKLELVVLLVILFGGAFFAYKHFWYRDPDAIYVGVSADYKPFAYKEKNDLLGFDIELSRKIGEELGKKVIFKEIDFPSLIMSVEGKKLDFAVSGISPTERRKEVLDFSEPYFVDDFCFITKDPSIKNLSQLRGMRVGVQQGAIISILGMDWQIKYGFKLISYNLNTQILQTLQSGHISAMLIAFTEGREIVKQDKKMLLIKIDESLDDIVEGCAIAFPKGSTLTSEVDNILKNLKKTGWLRNLKIKYDLIDGGNQDAL